MRKSIIIIIVLAVLVSCNKNHNSRVKIISKTKIDSINSVIELQKFAQNTVSNLIEFNYISPQQNINNYGLTPELKHKLVTMFPKEELIKADFDNNGFTDIILTSEVESFFSVIAIMSYGDNKYATRLLTLPGLQNYYPFFPKLTYIDEIPCVELYTISALNQQKKIAKETLIFKYNAFLDYNDKPKDYKITKIEFERTGCYGTCPVFNITLRADSISNFRANYYNYKPIRNIIRTKIEKATIGIEDQKEIDKISKDIIKNEIIKSKDTDPFLEAKGLYETKLNDKYFEEICQIIGYTDFEKNLDFVSACGEASFLKIYFKDGIIKTITINDRIKIRGLSILFNNLSDLRFNKNWKKIK